MFNVMCKGTQFRVSTGIGAAAEEVIARDPFEVALAMEHWLKKPGHRCSTACPVQREMVLRQRRLSVGQVSVEVA